MKTTSIMLDTERALTDPGIVTLYDKSRFKHTGALTAVTTVKLASGLYAYVFNGTTSLITIAAAKSLSPVNKNNLWSASAWIKPTTTGEGTAGKIFSQTSGWYFGLANLALEAAIFHATTAAWAVSTAAISASAWHHAAMVYNRLGTLKLEVYVDGALMALAIDQAGVGAISDLSANPLILGNQAVADNTFDGQQFGWKIEARAWLAGEVLNQYTKDAPWLGR